MPIQARRHPMETGPARRTQKASVTRQPLPRGLALAIGSLPHRDPHAAVRLMLECCPEAPCWPQLPSLGFQETMIPQFAEGIPCIRVDRDTGRVCVERPEDLWQKLASFYECYLRAEQTGDPSAFAISAASARGLQAFTEKLSAAGPRARFPLVKGQITGPLTFGLSVHDDDGLPALYDENLGDVIPKALLMKGLWQLERLRSAAGQMILFVDEPVLASFGSAAMIHLSRDRAIACLRPVVEALQAAGAIVGSHCCGNTDWSLLIEAGVDILNFDAYLYRDSVGLYAESVNAFLARGGYLAWGIVPSERRHQGHTTEELFDLLLEGIRFLAERGISRDLLAERLLVTTSCGLGPLTEQEAQKAMKLLRDLSERIRGDFLKE